MNSFPKAILDTSALISLYELNLLQYLSLLYTQVLVPNAVEKEFLKNPRISELERSKRFQYLSESFNIFSGWFQQCKEYDENIIAIFISYDKKMGEGEAEAMAQNQYLDNLYEVIIDERFANKFARNKNMTVHGTLYLIAVLDIRFKVCNYFEYTEKMKYSTTHITDNVIQLVYREVQEQLL